MHRSVAVAVLCASLLAGEAGATLRESPWARVSRSLVLADALELATIWNPDVDAALSRWRAASRRRPQVTALPDPRIQYMDWLRQMTPQEERWMLELTQELPLPEKLRLAGRVADRDTQVAYLKYQVAVRDVLTNAKETYFELYYIDRAIRITQEIRRLYERYAALAAGGVEPGKASLPEQFRAESQRAQLGYDVVQLETMRRTEAARLRAITGAPDGTELGPTAGVPRPSGGPPPLGDLERIARQYNQELVSAGIEVRKAADQVRIARLASVPDLMVGTRYMRTGGQDEPGGDPTEDPIIVMAGVNLPIWRSKYRAMVEEAKDQEQAARSDRRARDLEIVSNLARAHFGLTSALRLVRLYRETLLPQARQALQSAEELARSGDASLLAVLETTSTVHNFELAALRATVDAYQNIARIEKILGTALKTAATRDHAADVSPGAREAGGPGGTEGED